MGKFDNQAQNKALNVAALSAEPLNKDEIKKVDLKDVSKDVKSENEADIKQKREAMLADSNPEPVEPVSPATPATIAAEAIAVAPTTGLAHPIMTKPEIIMHQMIWPGRDLVASHGGIVGELQSSLIQATKNKDHSLSAKLEMLLNKIGDATNHIKEMGEHAAHPAVAQLKNLLHGKQ